MTERTRLRLADAMKKLMIQKPVEKIRVSEICRLAEVERPTFYYHFKDKYDLMAWIFTRSAFHSSVTDLKDTAESMRQLRRDYMFYKRAYEDISQNALWRYMREYYVKRFTEEARRILGTDTLDPRLQFSIRMYCCGSADMTWDWLLNDSKTEPEELASMVFESMPNNMREIFFRKQTLPDGHRTDS